MRLCIVGAGALGSQIALHLAHPDHTMLVIDDDVVEDVNLTTTTFSTPHLGCRKATVLSEMLYHKCGCVAEPMTRTLTQARQILSWKPELTIDTLDNAEGRAITHGLWMPTLHVGVSTTRVGAIIWDGRYQVPEGPARGQAHICTWQVGRPILRLTAALAANVVEHWMGTEEQRDVWVTEDGRTYA